MGMSSLTEESSYLNRMLEAGKNVGRGKMTDKYYQENFLNKGQFVCNPLLRLSADDYHRFLARLSLKIRREFLLKSTGMTYREVAKIIGYASHTPIQKFMGSGSFNTKISQKLIAQLAILFRVPPEWLMEERITDNEWVTYHFHHLGLEKKRLISFLEILNNVKDTEVWIRNFILKGVNPDNSLFLRVECRNKNFLVEIFNQLGDIRGYNELIAALYSKFDCILGEVLTAIPSQRNAAIICIANRQTLFSVPIEFRKLDF